MPLYEKLLEMKKKEAAGLADAYVASGPTNYGVEAAEQVIDTPTSQYVAEEEVVNIPQAPPVRDNAALLAAAQERRNRGQEASGYLEATDLIGRSISGADAGPKGLFAPDKSADTDINYYRNLISKDKDREYAEEQRQQGLKDKKDLIKYRAEQPKARTGKPQEFYIKNPDGTHTAVLRGPGGTYTNLDGSTVDVKGKNIVTSSQFTEGKKTGRQKEQISATKTRTEKYLSLGEKRLGVQVKNFDRNLDRNKRTQLNGLIDKFKKDPVVKPYRQTIASVGTVRALITKGGAAASTVIPTFIARMTGEKGVLTQQDVERAGGSQALADRVNRWGKLLATGKLGRKDKKDFLHLVSLMDKRAKTQIEKLAKSYSTDYSGQGTLFQGEGQNIYNALRYKSGAELSAKVQQAKEDHEKTVKPVAQPKVQKETVKEPEKKPERVRVKRKSDGKIGNVPYEITQKPDFAEKYEVL